MRNLFKNIEYLFEQYFSYLIVALVFVVGIFLRFYHLGKAGFWWDELYHVMAAKSLLTDGSLHVTLMGDYTRAYPITLLTALMFKLFGINEFVGRAFFSLINLVFIVTASFIIKRFFTRGTALLFFIVMCLSPFEIVLARECRMYSLFQFTYFMGAFLMYIGLEADVIERRNRMNLERLLGVDFLYLLLGGIALFFSSKLHSLTYNFVFVLYGYCLVMIIQGLVKKDFQLYHLKYLSITAVVPIMVYVLYLIKPQFFEEMWVAGTTIPVWWPTSRDTISFYRYFLSDNYPTLFFLYPISALLLITKFRKRGLFVVLNFVILFVVHSFVFQRKLDRYIFYIFPFFVLGSSYFCSEIIRYISTYINSTTQKSLFITKAVMVLSALIAFNAIGYPWLSNAKNAPTEMYWPHWKGFPKEIARDLDYGVIITTAVMPLEYYGGIIADYGMRVASDEYRMDYDKKKGVAVIRSASDLEKAFADAKKKDEPVYIVVTPWTFKTKSIVSESMKNYILKNTTRVSLGEYKSIIVFKSKDN